MRLNLRGRYAVLALIDLAMHQGEGHVSLASISRRLEISISYLEWIFARLRQRGIVLAARGPKGGYCLSRSTDGVSIGEIIQAIDGHSVVPTCGKEISGGSRDYSVDWVTRDLWASVNRKAMDYLHSISLSDLID